MTNDQVNLRMEIVAKLVRFEQPIATSLAELSEFAWDYDGEPFVVSADDVVSILNRFLADQLSAQDVEDWADAIEVREDIAFDENTDWTQETVHLLSNPSINGAITIPSVVELLRANSGSV
jgi:hypothetical protein